MIHFIFSLSWGIKNDVDCIAASFVRKASDVLEIRAFAAQLLKEQHPTDFAKYAVPRIISKIESTEALENFEEILEVCGVVLFEMRSMFSVCCVSLLKKMFCFC